jgi:hypothetical protein
MNNTIITAGGEVFVEVTDKAKEVFNSGLFDLYEVWEKDGVTHKYILTTASDLLRACDTNHAICINGGRLDEDRLLITRVSWDMADKITHDGFIYVRYSDIRFCR